nr:MAG TPA: hypothetical protein [Caudoviricetes sp.]
MRVCRQANERERSLQTEVSKFLSRHYKNVYYDRQDGGLFFDFGD